MAERGRNQFAEVRSARLTFEVFDWTGEVENFGSIRYAEMTRSMAHKFPLM